MAVNVGTRQQATTGHVARRGPYRHFNCASGCPGGPLTLADRELITGRSIRAYDPGAGGWFCGDCLTDLPPGLEAEAHVCGEVPGAVKVGDVVWYHGPLTAYHGVWEVTAAADRGLILFDVDRALWNVYAGGVTIVGRKGART